MNTTSERLHLKSDKRMELEGTISKRDTAIIVVSSVTAAIVADHLYPGWGRCVLVTAAVFGAAAIMWPQFRARWWYWFAWLGMLIVHIAALWNIVGVRRFLEEVNPVYCFLIGLMEFFFVAVVVIAIAAQVTKKEGSAGNA